jgi:L-asparaginase
MSSLPKVCVLVLGGTITMRPAQGSGIVPSLSGEALLSQVPSIGKVAEVSVITPFLKPGASLSFSDIARVAEHIRLLGTQGCDGVVVVQGTDTIDETSFLLDILLDGGPAVVVTGAMRGADAPGADGPANLVAAIVTASDRRLKDQGVVVVLNDEIYAAVEVEKTHTALPSAFSSTVSGPLGVVAEGRVDILRVLDKPKPARDLQPNFAKIAMVKIGLGDDDSLLRALPSLGYRGLVVEAMGAGHVPEAIVPALGELASIMPVVLTTRVQRGPVFTRTYGFPGSEIDLLGKGMIAAGYLRATKARLLLSTLVGNGLSQGEISLAFARSTVNRTV